VWTIHVNFLFRIFKFISSWPVALHKSLLEIMFGCCGSDEIKLLKYTSERKMFRTEDVGEMTNILQIQIDFPLCLNPLKTKTDCFI
jgi:hypothetical protein